MKTKFILHGGFTPGNQEENNSDFYKEILKDAPENAKVLIVPFAKDIERIHITTERVKGEFNQNKHQEKLNFEVANEESFIEQVKYADIIYFQGGTSLKLLEALKKFPELKDSLKGKTVAGESAGANVFGRFFFSPSANQIMEGLGILPLKIIPHYKEEYKDVFKDIAQDLENLFLKEYEYKVINLDI
ncbi:MAG: Type 1 glutamine amidotransferase-like domain-containing protein [Minisyncoccia bacterium]